MEREPGKFKLKGFPKG